MIGAGRVGSLIAYSIASRELVDELVLLDLIKGLAEGQAKDLSHAFIDKDMEISAGDYKEIQDSDIVIITAGKPRQPGQTRADLAKINSSIVSTITAQLGKRMDGKIMITVTNPTDTINYFIYKKINIARERIIGSTSILDSTRFKTVLTKRHNCSGKDVNAIVIGEHGEFQVPYFSGVEIKGKKVMFSLKEMEQIREEVRKSAMEVIEKKRATEYAPAVSTTSLVEAIIKDQKKTLPCSCILKGEYGLKDLSIGVPAVIGKNGIEKIKELELNEYEKAIFEKSAASIKECIGWCLPQ